jgi:hypothetical protein
MLPNRRTGNSRKVKKSAAKKEKLLAGFEGGANSARWREAADWWRGGGPKI